MSYFANPTGASCVALIQRDQNWLPRCIIIKIALAVADLERGWPQPNPGSEIVASPTEIQRPLLLMISDSLGSLSRCPRADLTLFDNLWHTD